MSAAEHLEVGEELPPLAELEEDQQTPSARQRAQRSLPLNRRRAWASVIEGQVLDVVATEAGQPRSRSRRADGSPRGLAALIPDVAASAPPAAPRAPRAAAMAPDPPAPAYVVVERIDPPAPVEVFATDTAHVDVADVDGETVVTVGEAVPVLPGPGAAILEALRVRRPLPDGLAPASERLAHPDAGWCACDGLPGHHRLDVTTLDVHQLDTAQRFWTIEAPTGGVLFTLCDRMTPKVTLQTATTAQERCRACDTHP